jgi:hypothetical protein
VVSTGSSADSDQAHSSSRRELLGGASATVLAGATALLVAGCGGSTPAPIAKIAHKKISHSAALLDVDILNGLLDTEHKAIAAYTAGIPLLSGHTQRAARDFLRDELDHANELGSLIARHGGTAIQAQPNYNLGSPRSRAEILRLFEKLEQEQIAAYLGAIPLVKPGAMRASLASILGSDAQHIAVLRLTMRKPALIGPFVTASGA